MALNKSNKVPHLPTPTIKEKLNISLTVVTVWKIPSPTLTLRSQLPMLTFSWTSFCIGTRETLRTTLEWNKGLAKHEEPSVSLPHMITADILAGNITAPDASHTRDVTLAETGLYLLMSCFHFLNPKVHF